MKSVSQYLQEQKYAERARNTKGKFGKKAKENAVGRYDFKKILGNNSDYWNSLQTQKVKKKKKITVVEEEEKTFAAETQFELNVMFK